MAIPPEFKTRTPELGTDRVAVIVVPARFGTMLKTAPRAVTNEGVSFNDAGGVLTTAEFTAEVPDPVTAPYPRYTSPTCMKNSLLEFPRVVGKTIL
jgi:hypothetical protein